MIMGDQKSVNIPKKVRNQLDNSLSTATSIVLRPSSSLDEEGSSNGRRPKRQRKKWPPRSPSPFEEEVERDELDIKTEHDEKGKTDHDMEEEEAELDEACEEREAELDDNGEGEEEEAQAEHDQEEGESEYEEPVESHPFSEKEKTSKGARQVCLKRKWSPSSASPLLSTTKATQHQASGRHSDANKKGVRQKGQEWKQLCVLLSENALQKWLKEKEAPIAPARWAKKRTSTTQAGFKRYYHCSIVSCKAELVALYPSHSEEVVVSCNCQDHVHPEDVQEWGLPPKTKQEIVRLWESGLRKPRMFRSALYGKGMGGFKDNQLSNFLTRLRKSIKPTTPPLAISGINEWCNEHSISQPTAALDGDVDRIYVIDHNASAKTHEFHFILSSKRLLKFVAQASTINVDASHKLKWFDSSVLFLGVSDACGQFFPVLFAVMSAETKANYTQLLKVLKRCVEAASGSDFLPGCVIGHSDAQLTEAAKEVFPSAARRLCWLRAKKDMSVALKREDKEARDGFEKDIAALQLSCDKEQFETAAQLMLQKWRELWPASAFPEYFEERYVKLNSGWHEGFDIASHSSNKRLASAMNEVKNRHTLRERLPLERFLDLAVELVREWSVAASETGELLQSVEPDDALLKETCLLQSLQKTMVEVNSAIYIPAGDRTVATGDEVDVFESKMRGDVGSFDDFMSARMSLWKVEDTGDKSDLAYMRCTCPRFFTGKLCEHVLSIGSAYGVFSMPQSVWDTLPDTSDGKRKRGRPSKNKSSGLELMSVDPALLEYCVKEGLEQE